MAGAPPLFCGVLLQPSPCINTPQETTTTSAHGIARRIALEDRIMARLKMNARSRVSAGAGVRINP